MRRFVIAPLRVLVRTGKIRQLKVALGIVSPLVLVGALIHGEVEWAAERVVSTILASGFVAVLAVPNAYAAPAAAAVAYQIRDAWFI